MAEDRQSTPEKQLLKLIEESRKGSGKESKPKRPGGSLLSLGALRGLILGFISPLKRFFSQKKPLSFKKFTLSMSVVNRVLTVSVLAIFVYVVTDAVAQTIALNHVADLDMKKDAAAGSSIENMTPLKEISYYIQRASSRDIFRQGKKEKTLSQTKEVPPVEESDVMKNLSLVGISWSSNPDVIIEDKKRKRTYFAKRGTVFGEGLRVEAVFKDRVVLSHDGEEFELR